MCLLCYLGDWLVVVELRELLLRHQDFLLQLCGNLGIMVNWKKSDLVPLTCLQYVSMVIGMSLELVFPSQDCLTLEGPPRS